MEGEPPRACCTGDDLLEYDGDGDLDSCEMGDRVRAVDEEKGKADDGE